MSDIHAFCPLWDEWEPVTLLGKGSFGSVWKMQRSVFGDKVYYAAVKHVSIPQDENEIQQLMEEGILTDRTSAIRYYRQYLDDLLTEIDAMHKLQGYTNIVSYEDHKIVPKKNGIGYDLFLRMELLTPLTERMKYPMKLKDILDLGVDIAAALEVLQAQHMIHRDIKPQNIFINDLERYKLGDYGTARALDKGSEALSIKGTYQYMAPEIYNGRGGDIRSDIYSLGIVLYRLLNNHRAPFLPAEGSITSSQTAEGLSRRMSGEEIPAPHTADPELAAIVLKALAFRPEDRYQTAASFRRDLEWYRDKQFNPQINNEPEVLKTKNNPDDEGRTGGSRRAGFPADQRKLPEKSGAAERSGPSKANVPVPKKENPGNHSMPSEPLHAETHPKRKLMMIPAAVLIMACLMWVLAGLTRRPLSGPQETTFPDSGITWTTEMSVPASEGSGQASEPTEVPPAMPEPTEALTAAPELTPDPTETPTTAADLIPGQGMLPESVSEAAEEHSLLSDSPVTVGDVIRFGRYEQDNDSKNGLEDIEWVVLDVQEGKCLLLSKYALDAKAYHKKETDITWEKCTLRKWLNEEFLNTAFRAEEKEAILMTEVDNSDQQGFREYLATGGNNTQDRVFLLSYYEAFTLYFPDNEARICGPTAFASAHGANTNKTDGKSTGWWWLRSPGSEQRSATNVTREGFRNFIYAHYTSGCVRPAVWINLESETIHALFQP